MTEVQEINNAKPEEFDPARGLSPLQAMFVRIFNKKVSDVDIRVNGDRPQDFRILRKRFYRRMLWGFLGMDKAAFGESFMAGEWDVHDIADFASRIVNCANYKYYTHNLSALSHTIPMRLFNHQSKKEARRDIARHYDLGLELFSQFLDKNMNYSCGYWRTATNLEDAQIAKMNLIGRKLKLEKGMKVLDIGCGYGSLAKYLAETWDVEVTGVTISQDQVNYAHEHFQSDKVNIMMMDYRDLVGKKSKKDREAAKAAGRPASYEGYFDRVVSVGMFEHVGHKNYSTYFDVVKKVMKDDTSLFLLHTIGLNHLWMPPVDNWGNNYIFRNGMLPYYTQIISETKNKLFLEDWHNFGQDYAPTLLAWYANFERNWPKIKTLLFETERLKEKDKRIKIQRMMAKNLDRKKGLLIDDEPTGDPNGEGTAESAENQQQAVIEKDVAHLFFRMWKFYLLFAAGTFKARKFNLWQVVFSKNGVRGGYLSER